MIFGESRFKFARAMLLSVFLRFENGITSAKNHIFSIRKNFLVADMLLYQKRSKSENQPRKPPGPLIKRQQNSQSDNCDPRVCVYIIVQYALSDGCTL